MLSKKVAVVTLLGFFILGCALLLLTKLRRHWHDVPNAIHALDANRVGTPLDVNDASEVIYDGKLSPGWNDWGWGPHDLSIPGPAKVVFAGYGGIILQHGMLQPQFSGLSFRYKAPPEWPDFLTVALRFASSDPGTYPQVTVQTRHVALLPDGFREVLIPWSELDPTNAAFDRVVISAGVQVGTEAALVDKVLLLRGDPKRVASGAAPERSVTLEIQCAGATHPISPLIYGSANGDWESGTTARRLGGNPTSRYNWDLSAWNSANDWFFENGKGPDLQTWLSEGVSHQTRAALTVPMIGWVAKDTSSVGFPVSKLGKQQKTDPNRSDAGNGMDASGKPIRPGPETETSVAASPDRIAGWIRALRQKDEARGARSVETYILDNEPSLWDQTHRDVHPDPLTYDELLDRTIRYASAIRSADPDVKIAGPAEWGWLGYLYSGRDRAEGKFIRSDRRLHGDEPLIVWYLKQLAQYEREHGKRLLDVLDLHFYPAAEGVYNAKPRTDADGAELRLRSTRSLWDASYVDESWINDSIRLLPRMKEWVAANYPGLAISLGEWSFGADDHISGALATAEALGRFGQQGLDSAYYWDGPKKDTGTFWAFRAFRNFDGAGGHFLELSLPTHEADKISLFASVGPSKDNVVAIAINRDAVFAVTARLAIKSCGSLQSARAFTYSPGSRSLAPAAQPAPQTDGSVVTALAPYSITVLDLHVAPGAP